MPKKPGFHKIGPYHILEGGEGTYEDRLFAMREAEKEILREISGLERVVKGASLKEIIDLEVDLFFIADRRARESLEKLKSHGISQDIRDLFAAKRKNDAERIAKRITIRHQDLAALALNSEQLGLTHRFKAKEFHPHGVGDFKAPLEITKPGSSFFNKEGKAWFKRVSHMFNQRKRMHVHMFENDKEWHFLFFDFSDTQGHGGKVGPHIHYCSHLWGVPKEETFRVFDTRGNRPTCVHIKYEDRKR